MLRLLTPLLQPLTPSCFFFVCENVTHIPMDCFVWCLWRALSELVASNFGVMVVQFPKRNVDIYYGEKWAHQLSSPLSAQIGKLNIRHKWSVWCCCDFMFLRTIELEWQSLLWDRFVEKFITWIQLNPKVGLFSWTCTKEFFDSLTSSYLSAFMSVKTKDYLQGVCFDSSVNVNLTPNKT